MKQDIQNGMNCVGAYVDQIKLFVIANNDGIKSKCRCECKELIDRGTCDKGYFFNPSNCDLQM